MSKVCDFCGKGPVSGNTVSHAHNVNLRTFKPNLRQIKENGVSKTICMKCLKTASKVR